MTYAEIERKMNPKYESEIKSRRALLMSVDDSEPLTGCQIFVLGCDLMLNSDFWTDH